MHVGQGIRARSVRVVGVDSQLVQEVLSPFSFLIPGGIADDGVPDELR